MLDNNKKEYENYIVFQNQRVDYANLKCLSIAIKNTNIQTLKLTNNNLKEDEINILKSIIKDNPIKVLFLENYIWGDRNDFMTML